MLRGKFIEINGSADIFPNNINILHEETQKSLSVFLDGCREKGIEPKRSYSGKDNARLTPATHAAAALAARAEGKSLNDWTQEQIQLALRA